MAIELTVFAGAHKLPDHRNTVYNNYFMGDSIIGSPISSSIFDILQDNYFACIALSVRPELSCVVWDNYNYCTQYLDWPSFMDFGIYVECCEDTKLDDIMLLILYQWYHIVIWSLTFREGDLIMLIVCLEESQKHGTTAFTALQMSRSLYLNSSISLNFFSTLINLTLENVRWVPLQGP